MLVEDLGNPSAPFCYGVESAGGGGRIRRPVGTGKVFRGVSIGPAFTPHVHPQGPWSGAKHSFPVLPPPGSCPHPRCAPSPGRSPRSRAQAAFNGTAAHPLPASHPDCLPSSFSLTPAFPVQEAPHSTHASGPLWGGGLAASQAGCPCVRAGTCTHVCECAHECACPCTRAFVIPCVHMGTEAAPSRPPCSWPLAQGWAGHCPGRLGRACPAAEEQVMSLRVGGRAVQGVGRSNSAFSLHACPRVRR